MFCRERMDVENEGSPPEETAGCTKLQREDLKVKQTRWKPDEHTDKQLACPGDRVHTPGRLVIRPAGPTRVGRKRLQLLFCLFLLITQLEPFLFSRTGVFDCF